ncbi:hypothetical protein ACNKHO_23580 [Shigella flexneri]
MREALRDLLALQEKLVTIDNIQKTVAEYYKSKLRTCSPSVALARWRVAPDGDGVGERAHQPQSAGNWRCVWWP